MATTQYIGARYVPLFANPIEWDNTKEYEPLTIVIYKGNSYTSRQYVPAGVEINNDAFWALTGNYNAQVEQYRKEVHDFSNRIDTVEADSNLLKNKFPITTNDIADNAITNSNLGTKCVASNNIIDNAISNDKIADGAVTTDKIANKSITSSKLADNVIIGVQDGSVTTDKIADGSVTSAKIANEAVTTDKIADGSVTSAKIANEAVTTDKIADGSVTSAKIADGSITSTKIDSTVTRSILNSLTIKYFNNKVSSANNDGLVVPNNCDISGFYIVEFNILVINEFVISSTEWLSPSSIIKLPSYVPRPTSTLQVGTASLIRYDSSSDFLAWTGLRYNSDGSLYPNTGIPASMNAALIGAAVLYLRPYSSGSTVTTSTLYNSFVEQNGCI